MKYRVKKGSEAPTGPRRPAGRVSRGLSVVSPPVEPLAVSASWLGGVFGPQSLLPVAWPAVTVPWRGDPRAAVCGSGWYRVGFHD